MEFRSLGLTEPILKGVAEAGYAQPTEIQARAIPIAQAGKDLVALGETGSGKTAAYGLPLLERLLGGKPGLRALILVPTRELCVQVAENLRVYAAHTDLRVCTAFGGIPITIQEAAFRRGVDVLVACPGRLIDHAQCGNLEFKAVEVLILDEADRMLDMGFMPQIRKVLSLLPHERQNLLFSATMPPEIERLVRDGFGDCERVQIGQRSQSPRTIDHRFAEVRAEDKETFLAGLLRRQEGRVLIFVKTKVRAEQLGKRLQRAGLPADSIHGDKSAESRHVVLQAFARGKVQHLVATDVAARGIDVSDIAMVVNADMPRAVEDYVHRVGRTGRAGSTGAALSLVTRADKGMMKAVLAHLERTSDARARVVVDSDGEPARQDRGGRDAGRDAGRNSGRTSGRGGRPRGAARERPAAEPRAAREREPERVAREREPDRAARRQLAARDGVALSTSSRGPAREVTDVVWDVRSEGSRNGNGHRKRERGGA
jgi:ATP-dependent RNA helicase RhlE